MISQKETRTPSEQIMDVLVRYYDPSIMELLTELAAAWNCYFESEFPATPAQLITACMKTGADEMLERYRVKNDAAAVERHAT
jgi:hypothetical protein